MTRPLWSRQIQVSRISFSNYLGTNATFTDTREWYAEEITSKQSGASHPSRRSSSWLNLKCIHAQEFVIAGFTLAAESHNGVHGIGSLLLGYYDGASRLIVLPYLLLCREDAGQREHELRDVFDAVRYVARSGCAWRMIPGDLPPWAAVYQQFRRWLDAGVFVALVSDVQSIAREWAGRKGQQVTGRTVELAYVDQGHTGPHDAEPQNSTAYGSKWSSTPWQNAASCSCRADGSWNAPLPGPLASDASPETMNDSHKPSKEFTSSPSPSS
jgi:transposase